MDGDEPEGDGWADELRQLILRGRDREAAELASRHLAENRTETTTGADQ